MTIENTDRLVVYTGNGVTTEFPYDFLIPDAESVVITIYDAETNFVLEVLTPADYSISGLGNPEGGTVTYNPSGTPMPSTRKIVLERDQAYTQTLSIPNQSTFYPEEVEAQLDRIVMQTQQLAEQLDRTITLPPTATVASTEAFTVSILTLAEISDEIVEVADHTNNIDIVAGSISDVNTLAPIAADITTVAGIAASVSVVADDIVNVVTVGENITDVNRYANTYLPPAATPPTTRTDGSPLQEGDLWYDTSIDEMKKYDGSAFSLVTTQSLGGLATGTGTFGASPSGRVEVGSFTVLFVWINGFLMREGAGADYTQDGTGFDINAPVEGDEWAYWAYQANDATDYYTKIETDGLLADKADVTDVYTKAEIDDRAVFGTVGDAEAHIFSGAAAEFVDVAFYDTAKGDASGARYSKVGATPDDLGIEIDGAPYVISPNLDGRFTTMINGAAGNDGDMDSASDDRASIQEILDFVGKRGGGHIVVNRPHRIVGKLDMWPNITLEFLGGAHFRQGASLVAGTPTVMMGDNVNGGNNLRLVNPRLFGNTVDDYAAMVDAFSANELEYAISFRDGTGYRVEGGEIDGFSYSSFEFSGASTTDDPSQIVIDGLRIRNVWRGIWAIHGIGDGKIINCDIRDTGGVGIGVDDLSGAAVYGPPPYNWVASNNSLIRCAQEQVTAALFMTATVSYAANGNIIKGSGRSGVSSKAITIGNGGNSEVGSQIMSGGMVSGNVIDTTEGVPIDIQGARYSQIRGNTIIDFAANTGITSGSGGHLSVTADYNVIDGNLIAKRSGSVNVGIALAAGARYTSVSLNRFRAVSTMVSDLGTGNTVGDNFQLNP